LIEALKNSLELRTIPLVLQILVNAAVWFLKDGRTDRAATLLGVVRDHPASDQETQDRARHLLDEMELVAPEGEPEALDALVTGILTELVPATSSGDADSPPG
jgi:hypothetical protein